MQLKAEELSIGGKHASVALFAVEINILEVMGLKGTICIGRGHEGQSNQNCLPYLLLMMSTSMASDDDAGAQ